MSVLEQQKATTNHWDGKKYNQNSDQQKNVADLLLKQHLFKSTDVILDVGCGDGRITSEMAHMLTKGVVLGIDPSDSMIDFAKNKYQKDNLQFELGKASTISYQNTFDVITAFSCLHWEPEQEVALECFKRALKPGGTILLAIPGPDLILRSALKEITSAKDWYDYFKDYQSPGRIWTTNEYAHLLLKTHFIIQKIEIVDRTYVAENENRYKSVLNGMLPHLSRLSENLHTQFINDLTKKVQKKLSDLKINEFRFQVKVIEIIAQTPSKE